MLNRGVSSITLLQGEGRALLAARDFMLGEALPTLALVPKVCCLTLPSAVFKWQPCQDMGHLKKILEV